MTYNPKAAWDRSELARLRAENAGLRHDIDTIRDTLEKRTQSHAALVRDRIACPRCSTLPIEELTK